VENWYCRNYAKIGGKKVQLKDHSIFVAFAPKENPKK
jgi:penicillin-binding protein 2